MDHSDKVLQCSTESTVISTVDCAGQKAAQYSFGAKSRTVLVYDKSTIFQHSAKITKYCSIVLEVQYCH